ncbi:hypothetical protein [Roseomonas sp. KE0001]|uniref:hypothetical protein n=1 Tax=unclassified Roseomonas TaxID=2617492 RepID=UPI0018E026CF|nr:hypothetical protein [Roseomonas sp. KE0001]MBI0433886.1 hypothetical protein [Roseomonas sp. KE0001]
MSAWIRNQIAQPSTWRGLFLIMASGFGITLSPELQSALPNFAVAALGLYEALRREVTARRAGPDAGG